MGSVAQQEPPDEQVFARAQDTVTALFEVWAAVRGRQIDTQKAAFLAAQNKENNA